MKVLLFITATGKYIKYVPELIAGAEKYFLQGAERAYIIFTDCASPPALANIKYVKTSHRIWPYSSMLRCVDYNLFIKSDPDFINDHQYAFAIDADTRIVSEINTEILQESIAVQHCAYVNREGEFETNPDSVCYVSPGSRSPYIGGGFYGGDIASFIKINRHLQQCIEADQAKGIMPRWHDESALNHYFSLHPPSKILPPSYHYPEFGPKNQLNPYIGDLWEQNAQYIHNQWGISLPILPKIVLIDKYQGKSSGANHMRE